MLFQTVVSVALLATSASAVAGEVKREPYRPAVMAVPGQSLMRRSTAGYTPNQKQCNKGDTCAVACGAEYTECSSSTSAIAHCFSPSAGESCCTDGSGNSCEKGYYCTHDKKKQTWCCPNDMDLNACAAAFSVTGGLAAATAKTTSTKPTSAPVTSTAKNTTTICTASIGTSTAWTAMNSTTSAGPVPTPPPVVNPVSGASSSGVSVLLLAAAAAAAAAAFL